MLTAAEQSARGWGGPIALAIAVAVFWAITEIARRVRDGRAPSPTEGAASPVGITPQVRSVSDTDDTDGDTGGWWGQIVDKNGRRYREIAHVVRTGASLPPDNEIDLGLGDEGDDDGDETREGETLLEYVDRLDRAGIGYAALVRQAMDEYEVSSATAKRRIRDARDAREARAAS